jgi:uncharacterized protein YraI
MIRKYNSRLLIMAIPVLLMLVSLACGLTDRFSQAAPPGEFAPTRTPVPTFTPTAAGAAFVEVPTISPQPTLPPPTPTVAQPVSVVATPTVDASPTPAVQEVTITVLQNMNVRGGPGTNYPIVGPGPAGQSAKVLGRNADASWLQIEYPSADGLGWIFAKLVQVNGDPQTVSVAQAPPPPAAPPPAAAPQPQPQQAEAPPPAPEKKYQFTPTGWHASENGAIVQFKGRIKTEGGGLVNGFSVLADNGAFRVQSHPTGASQWYPDKGDGEWDIVMPNIASAQGWWWLTVIKYECDFAGGFNAQCDRYTKLSEDIKIQVITPKESIINADWICHWDCDKGLYVNGYRRP